MKENKKKQNKIKKLERQYVIFKTLHTISFVCWAIFYAALMATNVITQLRKYIILITIVMLIALLVYAITLPLMQRALSRLYLSNISERGWS